MRRLFHPVHGLFGYDSPIFGFTGPLIGMALVIMLLVWLGELWR